MAEPGPPLATLLVADDDPAVRPSPEGAGGRHPPRPKRGAAEAPRPPAPGGKKDGEEPPLPRANHTRAGGGGQLGPGADRGGGGPRKGGGGARDPRSIEPPQRTVRRG